MPAFYPEGDEPKLADPSGRSLHKINNLLKSIEAKTGSTTITGPVTVSNEVEVTNESGNPIPVSGTVALDSNSLAALENISVTFPATQNVNVTNAGLSVSVSNIPATQPVSGTFWPTTQPVSGTVSVSNLPETQPISGSVSVSNFPATQPVSLATAPTTPVTGTFWQTTQPVSLATAPTTPVTGTFWQTTQPISGTVTSRIADGAGNNLTSVARGSERALSVQIVDASGAQVTTFGGGGGASGGLTDAELRAAAVPVSLASVPSHAVTGPLTNSELRATAVPVQISSYPVGSTASFSSFTSTSSLSFAGSDATRKVLTVFNEGNGTLYIKPGGAAVSSTDYQIRMSPGDYWEVPVAQIGLQHLGIFVGAGTARITSIS